MAGEGQVPPAYPPWPTPVGGYDRILKPTRRRSFLGGAAGAALGGGCTNVVLGLTNHNANNEWVGAASVCLGVVFAAVLVRRRLARNRGASPPVNL